MARARDPLCGYNPCMTSRYLQISQMGFYFTLGTPFDEDGDFSADCAYFEQCFPAVRSALRALPIWTQTIEEQNDPMQIHPFSVAEFDGEIEVLNDKVAYSFWVISERLVLFPKEHVEMMRDAINAVMAAAFVKATSYQEWRETFHEDVAL